MPRITELDLTATRFPHTAVPMPGATQPLAMMRLDSAPGRFTLHGHFPAGFERSTPGGYEVTEEFLLLEGELDFEGVRLTAGDLTFVPAHYQRTRMATAGGCTVLAWFGGPAVFVPAAQLAEAETGIGTGAGTATGTAAGTDTATGTAATAVVTIRLPASSPSEPWHLPSALWQAGLTAEDLVAAGTRAADILEPDLSRWSRWSDGVSALPEHPFIARLEAGP